MMTKQNLLQAARETLELARMNGQHNCNSDTPAADYEHLLDMMQRMEHNFETMSEAKLCRWLGWMQGCVYCQANGDIALDDFKEINKQNSSSSDAG